VAFCSRLAARAFSPDHPAAAAAQPRRPEIAAGELSQSYRRPRRDEVGALATTFNAMAASSEVRHWN
jgi:methyl-accepting chemotaxis protein